MTEPQGGSDVRANITFAEKLNDVGEYKITGRKWFCSAPMSDAFLTLAYAPGGLSCFLVPRIAPDGERNRIQLMRLKDKLGSRSMAAGETIMEGAVAYLLGQPNHGLKQMMDQVSGQK